MSVILASNLKFLPPLKQGQSKRDKELEDADKRAHAAKISHQKRRQEKEGERRKRQQQLPHIHVCEHYIDEAHPRGYELALLLHGSSDPFNSFPVRITPEINRLITYARDVMLPNMFVPPYMKRLTLATPKTLNYEDSNRVIGGSSFLLTMKVFSNANEGFALAWLSSHTPAIRRLASTPTTQKLLVEGLKMRTRSIELLRQELLEHPEPSQHSLVSLRLHIRGLFEAECMAGDTISAKVHGAILMRLDDPLTTEMELVNDTIMLMFNATELACKKLERTVIPFGNWMIGRLSKFWATTSAQMPGSSAECENVHSCVQSPLTRTAFIRLRYCLEIGESQLSLASATEKLRGEMLYGWITTKTLYDMGLLVNFYTDLLEGKTLVKTKGKRLTEACMAVTLLHILRKSIHEAPLDGIDIREASDVIIPRLEKNMEDAMSILTRAERLYYDEAYLWMFYVGAQYEQGRKSEMKDTYSRGWFTRMLAKHARQSNVRTWADVKKILVKFIYDKNLKPEGHLWFEKAIGTVSN